MVTERLVLVAATLVLAAVGLRPVAAMLKETLIADGRFSLEAYRALLASGDHLALLMSHSLQLAFLLGQAGVAGEIRERDRDPHPAQIGRPVEI